MCKGKQYFTSNTQNMQYKDIQCIIFIIKKLTDLKEIKFLRQLQKHFDKDFPNLSNKFLKSF